MLATKLIPPVAIVALLACGGAPPPHDALGDARAAVRAAEELGAEGHPNAALHLKMARDQIQVAHGLMADEANEAAQRALIRAALDAEVALERARAADMTEEARKAQNEVRALADDDSQALRTE